MKRQRRWWLTFIIIFVPLLVFGGAIYVVSSMTGIGLSYGEPTNAVAAVDLLVDSSNRGDLILATKEILVAEGFSADAPYQTKDPRSLQSLRMQRADGTKATLVMAPPSDAVKLYFYSSDTSDWRPLWESTLGSLRNKFGEKLKVVIR